jgi:hypothetical protein
MAMRLPVVAVVLCLLAGPVIADKDPNIIGTYDVKYEEVANNCTTANTGIALQRGTLKVGKKGKTVTVDIQRFELMSGSQAKGGKLKATSKVGMSPIDGTTAKASVAGRVEENLIELVFVVEFYVDKKPLCTESWNVSGAKTQDPS